MPKQRGLLMYCSDSLTSSVVASVVEMQCRQLCAPKTSSMTSLTGPAPFGITISRRAVVRRTRHSNVRCPDIFRFVEIASNRTRIVFAAKIESNCVQPDGTRMFKLARKPSQLGRRQAVQALGETFATAATSGARSIVWSMPSRIGAPFRAQLWALRIVGL
jgi:hypothetical protein